MIAGCFSDNYGEARSRFLAAAAGLGEIATFAHPAARGPSGEALFTDLLRIGPPPGAAPAVCFVNSGTHGIEGYCGSGCQVRLIREGLAAAAPPGVAIVLVHALNPYGFAHGRRVTEDNVDLNRNFIDHGRPPSAPAYARLHPYLVPDRWDLAARARADAALAALRADMGDRAYQEAVTSGQYSFPDGLFFGGHRPSWSNKVWRGIVDRHAAGARRIAFIDFHTGLGPNGVGELIVTGAPDPASMDRMRHWWGEVTSADAGTSTSAPVRGALSCAFDHLAHVEKSCVALEFGTVPLAEMLEAVRADNWLYARGGGERSPDFAPIKAQIRAAFYDERTAWMEAVSDRAVEVFERALRGLGED